MRLGSNEALIFTSGRPVIRATKLRYYSDPSFKRLAQLAPPPKSDRIEYAPVVVDLIEQANDGTEKGIPPQMTPDQVATGTVRRLRPAPAEQLSFLNFAVDNGKYAVESPKEEGAKERLL
ncbi:MAG TPA: hypothetical protein VJN94_03630 [Candidatus Binataceae bacterium]|nr:hypothetical protein [Candidatus Binataceae bacterium]